MHFAGDEGVRYQAVAAISFIGTDDTVSDLVEAFHHELKIASSIRQLCRMHIVHCARSPMRHSETIRMSGVARMPHTAPKPWSAFADSNENAS